MFYEVQLQWIQALHQALRSSWMDVFFKCWNYVDTSYFVIAVIVLVWYLWNKRTGAYLFYAFIVSCILNQILKEVFHQPRPCQIDPLVGVLCFSSPGFPSGGAQTATILSGFVFFESKRIFYRWLAVIFALFVYFSRVYLGVHYPTDILGGIVVGGVILFACKTLFPVMERMWKVAAIGFPFVILLLFYLGLPVDSSLFFSTLGVGVGLLMHKKSRGKTARVRVLQTCSVLGGLVVLFVAGAFFPAFACLWNFAKGYWLSFLGARLVRESFNKKC